MFSIFKKKHSEPAAAPLGDSPDASPVPAVDFDFTAQAPDGWELLIDGENPAAIGSFEQVRSALAGLEEWGFAVVQKSGDPALSAQALYKGERCYQPEVLTGNEPLIYGLPTKKGRNSEEAGLDDAAAVLCTFIRDDGALPQIPHLVTSHPEPGVSFGGL
ncbi:hypothetical protein HMPREF3172_06450 [Brevibacterium sp. HMSC08F02]|uniref:hypothetical protein n=1 Tax=Brevibacterium sp. HMSC08F02 TaxID=1581140 RepID=UPI0008A0FD59|nr:hypothetical protein [Brevibacterium sp. HMSC08F02]OFT25654.1 hypothetical protein HMPREF3172_06450 [Brevibacterium sp. HMSC08F02]